MDISEDTVGAIGVTGANGFVGAAVIRCLVAAGFPAVAFSRGSFSPPAPATWRSLGELGRTTPAAEHLQKLRAVIHCAARVHVMRESTPDPLAAFRDVNCRGTLELARAAAAAGVPHFIFVSTIKVMGEETAEGRPFRPGDSLSPCDPYAISKAEAEEGLAEVARESGMTVTIARPVLVYGPGVRANFAALAKAARSGLPLPISNIANRRSFVFVENLADLLVRLAVDELPGGRIYLPSDGPALSTPQLVREMARAQGREVRLFPAPLSLARLFARLAGKDEALRRLVGNLEVDRDHLEAAGWVPPFDLAEGLTRTFSPLR